MLRNTIGVGKTATVSKDKQWKKVESSWKKSTKEHGWMRIDNKEKIELLKKSFLKLTLDSIEIGKTN